jgi:iduronate 2-sulfatase
MLNDPGAPGKDGADSWFRPGQYEGSALRTDRYRLVEWVDTKTDNTAQIELYGHATDPQENVNVAGEKPEVVERLQTQLHALEQQQAR